MGGATLRTGGFFARRSEAGCDSLPHRAQNRLDHPAAMIVGREQLPALWHDLESRVRARGGTPAGMAAINSIRLEWGTPWFGHDFGDKKIPHEAGLEHSHISYEKGCYTGQEIVERVRSRGHANRRLTELQFSGADAPSQELFSCMTARKLGASLARRFLRRLAGRLASAMCVASRPPWEPSSMRPACLRK